MLPASRWRPCALAVALVAAASSGGTSGAGRSTVLRIGMTSEPNSLSPLFALSDYEELVDR